MNNKIIIIITLSLFISCSKKHIPTIYTKKNNEASLYIPIDEKYLTLNGSIQYKDNTQNYNMRTQIRIKYDSIIWVSLSVFGFEAARVLLTKDSVYILNRLQKNYSKSSYKKIEELFHLHSQYPFIQSILLGNPFIHITKSDTIQYNEYGNTIKQNFQNYRIETLINNNNKKIEKIQISHIKTADRFSIFYSNYQSIYDTNALYPYSILIEGNYKNTSEPGNSNFVKTHIQIEKTEKGTNTLQFPFSIPESYEIH